MEGPGLPYLLCFALIFPLVLLWSLATPLVTPSDEPAHVYRAAAIWRGQWLEPLVPDPPYGRESRVTIPADLLIQSTADCLDKGVEVTADCVTHPALPHTLVPATTQLGQYPPLFSVLVGWPTHLVRGRLAFWALRLLASALSAGLLAIGLWAAVTSSRRALTLGWAVAVTPMVLYLGGVVNASGMELSAAVASWSVALAIATGGRPRTRLLVAAGVVWTCLCLARPLSPVFLLVAVGSTGIVAGRRQLTRLLLDRRVWALAAVSTAAGALALLWLLVAGAPVLIGFPPAQHVSAGDAAVATIFGMQAQLFGMVGLFGTNLFAPLLAVGLWFFALSSVGAGAAAFTTRRALVVVAALLLATVAMPVFFNIQLVNSVGPVWQSRYTLPLAIGLPMVLAAQVPDELFRLRPARQVTAAVLIATWAGHVLTFAWILHRFTSGLHGSWFPPSLRWEPPGGAYLLAACFVIGTAALALCSLWALAASRRRPASQPAQPGLRPGPV